VHSSGFLFLSGHTWMVQALAACAVQVYVHIIHQAIRALLGAETPNKPTTPSGRPKPEIAKRCETGAIISEITRDPLDLRGSSEKHTKAGLAGKGRVCGSRSAVNTGRPKAKTNTKRGISHNMAAQDFLA